MIIFPWYFGKGSIVCLRVHVAVLTGAVLAKPFRCPARLVNRSAGPWRVCITLSSGVCLITRENVAARSGTSRGRGGGRLEEGAGWGWGRC